MRQSPQNQQKHYRPGGNMALPACFRKAAEIVSKQVAKGIEIERVIPVK